MRRIIGIDKEKIWRILNSSQSFHQKEGIQPLSLAYKSWYALYNCSQQVYEVTIHTNFYANLDMLTCKKLQQLCKDNHIKANGKKKELITRLLQIKD